MIAYYIAHPAHLLVVRSSSLIRFFNVSSFFFLLCNLYLTSVSTKLTSIALPIHLVHPFSFDIQVHFCYVVIILCLFMVVVVYYIWITCLVFVSGLHSFDSRQITRHTINNIISLVLFDKQCIQKWNTFVLSSNTSGEIA